ncbi:hypothetical protein K6U55_18040, partial [Vibrio diabolicus]|uniref:hypothetical protein n=1 Tax=Vibrio diabolicus TaxID=50719 RepID=UPI00211ABD18
SNNTTVCMSKIDNFTLMISHSPLFTSVLLTNVDCYIRKKNSRECSHNVAANDHNFQSIAA